MFSGAYNFDSNLKKWKTSSVTIMDYMFSGATSFQGKGIERFKVDKVTRMVYLFSGATSFKPKKLGKWNTGNVENMESMFNRFTIFNDPTIASWNVEKVNNFNGMFDGSGFNSNINPWNIKNMKNALGMFSNSNFNQCLSTWADKIDEFEDIDSYYYGTRPGNYEMFNASGCPNENDPTPGVGPWCQGPAEECDEITFTNTCADPISPFNQENDQRCNKGCADISRKAKFTDTKKKIKRCKKKEM
jgi:surface protein